MKRSASLYKRHRFPPEIIQYAVWLYYRFNLSARDIEDLLAERGIVVSYESIRLWCIKFGPRYARRLKRRHQGYGDTFYIDEVFVKIGGRQHYLWRAVDQDGEVVDVLLQARRDGKAARRFFKRLLKTHRREPRKIVTDKLGSYGVDHRELLPDTIHRNMPPIVLKFRISRSGPAIPRTQRHAVGTIGSAWPKSNVGRG